MSSKSGSREARPIMKKTAADARAARSTTAVRRALRGESVSHDPLLSFSRTNYLLMLAGAVLAIIGSSARRRHQPRAAAPGRGCCA